MHMDISLILTVALAASFIVVVLVLVAIIIYQRWRIGDQNVLSASSVRTKSSARN